MKRINTYLFFRVFLCIILYTCTCQPAIGQSGEVRGVVYDKETGEVMLYTAVYLQGTKYGANTDVNGFYIISNIAPGDYTLVCTTIGYDSAKIPVTITPNKKLNQNIFLKTGSITLKEVTVSQTKTEKETRVGVSKHEITAEQIRTMPAVGGAPDLAQYLQMLPGVVSTGDQGGQLYIRGGTPVQNKVLLDGMSIYNPFHSIGLFSIFDVDIIKNVDVYTAAFGGQYGDAISAVMDVKTRDGNKNKFSGDIDINPFVSKISLEGPLQKFHENEGGSSFIFSARSSYLKQTAPVFYPYADTNGLPYTFNDFFGKVSFYAPGGSKLNLMGFDFTDHVDLSGTSYGWKERGGGLNFVLVPSSLTSTLIEGHLDYSDYQMTLTENDNLPRMSEINGFQAGMDFSYFPHNDLIKYGIEIDGYKTNFQFYNPANRLVGQTDYSTELAGYVRYNKVISRFILDPSLRITSYASLSEFSAEPRLAAKYLINTKFRLKASAGFYSQNLTSAQSDRDVVNFFYGYLSGPDDIPSSFAGDTVKSRLQKAWHAVGGIEGDVGKHTTITVETYIKDFTQLTNINNNKLFDNTPDNASKPALLKEDYIIENGKSYGVDFEMTWNKKPFYLWVVYSLGYSTRFDGIETYSTNWDRRHNLNILGTYSFGKNHAWEASARWNFGTGFPFTQTQGYYELLDFQQKGINTNYTKQNGVLGILYGALNQGRMSDYHRLDISVKRTWKLAHSRAVKLAIGATNVYNRPNVFYFNRVTSTRVNQLPLLPSVDVGYSF